MFARWLTLIRGLVGSQRIGEARVPFGPVDEVVVKTALAYLTGHRQGNTVLVETTIPKLWRLLDEPTHELIAECRYASTRQFLDETRLLRDALGQSVSGALAGLFDGPTTIDIDWNAPIQSLSLSRLEALGDEAVGIALTCLNSWSRGMRELAAPGDLRVVVRDESWKQLRRGSEAVKSFDADLRLSRRDGDVQVADTHILHGQDPAGADDLHRLLGLSAIEQDLVTGWAMQGKGRALWCVGDQRYKVLTIFHEMERRLFQTNERWLDSSARP